MITNTAIANHGYLLPGASRMSITQPDQEKLCDRRWVGKFAQRSTADESLTAARMLPSHVLTTAFPTGTPNGVPPSALPRRT
jgi:hypothetical protein